MAEQEDRDARHEADRLKWEQAQKQSKDNWKRSGDAQRKRWDNADLNEQRKNDEAQKEQPPAAKAEADGREAEKSEQKPKGIMDPFADERLPAISNAEDRITALESRLEQLEIEAMLRSREEDIEATAGGAAAAVGILTGKIGHGYTTETVLPSEPGNYGRYKGPWQVYMRDPADINPAVYGSSEPVKQLMVQVGYISAGMTSQDFAGVITTALHKLKADSGISISILDYANALDSDQWPDIGSVTDVEDYYLYIEMVVDPIAATCNVLWTPDDEDTYGPKLKVRRGSPPEQTPTEDRVVSAVLPCCNVILGHAVVKYKTWPGSSFDDGAGNLTETTGIVKWEQWWENGPIYLPVFKWVHTISDDYTFPGIDPVTTGLETTCTCVYGSTWCAPVCITPFDDVYQVHTHTLPGATASGGDPSHYHEIVGPTGDPTPCG